LKTDHGTPGERKEIEEDPFIVVLGDSHVRAFARHTAFLPLFIGSGKEVCFLTDQHAVKARERILANLKRIDPRPVMLFLGEPDTRLHLENKHGTRLDGAAADEKHVAQCAARYQAVITEVRRQWAAPLLIISPSPGQHPEQNALTQVYAGLMKEFCAREGIAFIDIWPHVYNPATGAVDAVHSADHIHLNDGLTRFVVPELQRRGLLRADVEPQSDFSWSYLYRFPVEGGETRIWGDADISSAAHRFKFGRTELVSAALSLVGAELPSSPRRALVGDCCEGFLPFHLPRLKSAAVTACDPDPRRIRAARRLQRFARRPEVEFLIGAWDEIDDEFDLLFSLDDAAVFEGRTGCEVERQQRFRSAFQRCTGTAFFLTRQPDDVGLAKAAGFAEVWRRSLEFRAADGANVSAWLLVASRQPRWFWLRLTEWVRGGK